MEVSPAFVNYDFNKPIMTKYEFTRIRGIRIQQLIDGMQPFIKYSNDDTYDDIFKNELSSGVLPLIITRPCGYNKTIDIPVSSMDVGKYV
tara:strand:- start:1473 stop:1742 length:270 start_codon:yes stop_codon:yes gene_type:complete